jgi:predicted nucleic acid-binding protein
VEWVERLQDKVVGLDTALLIYFIEDHPTYTRRLAAFFEAVDRGRIRVATSVVTLTRRFLCALSERAVATWCDATVRSH